MSRTRSKDRDERVIDHAVTSQTVVHPQCQPRNPTYRLAKPADGAGGGVFPEGFLRKALSWDAERDIIAVFFGVGNRINLGVGRIQQSGAGGDNDEAY
jgi:hypothetical protein